MNKEHEIWRPIVGLVGYAEICSLGFIATFGDMQMKIITTTQIKI